MFYGTVDICRRYSWHGPEEGFDYIIIYDPRSVYIAQLHITQLYTQHDITHPTVCCRYFVLYDIRQDALDVAPVISTCMLRL